MSDFNGIEVSDVLGLSAPLTKLIETVSAGVGKLYEPVHVRRMAKAKSEEVKLIGESVMDASEVPVIYQNGEVSIDSSDFDALAKRTGQRLAFQEMRKQQNIDCVVNNAACELGKSEKVSENPVDQDWVSRFFDSVANVSTSDMQHLWGKILAGEVESPGSFSLCMLDRIKNMSKKDAQLFEKIVTLTTYSGGQTFIYNDKDLWNKYDICLADIIYLEECGLLKANDLKIDSKVSATDYCEISTKNRVMKIKSLDSALCNIEIPLYTYSEIGKELFKVINAPSNVDFFEDIANSILKKYPNRLEISFHMVATFRGLGKCQYYNQPIKTIASNITSNN